MEQRKRHPANMLTSPAAPALEDPEEIASDPLVPPAAVVPPVATRTSPLLCASAELSVTDPLDEAVLEPLVRLSRLLSLPTHRRH